MDALVDARRRLAFLEEALNVAGGSLNKEQRKRLQNRLTAIGRRVESSELRLALVGEFNSGKTSFINAIFRAPFLKVSRRPTTAAAARIRYADRSILEATVDGESYVLDESNYRTLAVNLHERGYNVAADASFQDLIAAITADNKIGKITRDVALGFPSPTLEKGLVLLDAPGVSAGAEEVDYHKDVAIDVIENGADAAVVFLPRYASTNAEIIAFLKEHAEKYLDRAIFVLTQMDGGERDECELSERFARKIVREQLGVKKPTFYQTAAKVLLKPEQYDEDDRRYWIERFEEMERSLFSNILRLKSVVAEKIVELMLELTRELENALSEKKESLNEEKRVLASCRVETILETLHPIYETEWKRLERAFDSASGELCAVRSSVESRVRSKVERIINEADSRLYSQFDREYKPKIERATRQYVIDATRRATKKVKELVVGCRNVGKSSVLEGLAGVRLETVTATPNKTDTRYLFERNDCETIGWRLEGEEPEQARPFGELKEHLENSDDERELVLTYGVEDESAWNNEWYERCLGALSSEEEAEKARRTLGENDFALLTIDVLQPWRANEAKLLALASLTGAKIAVVAMKEDKITEEEDEWETVARYIKARVAETNAEIPVFFESAKDGISAELRAWVEEARKAEACAEQRKKNLAYAALERMEALRGQIETERAAEAAENRRIEEELAKRKDEVAAQDGNRSALALELRSRRNVLRNRVYERLVELGEEFDKDVEFKLEKETDFKRWTRVDWPREIDMLTKKLKEVEKGARAGILEDLRWLRGRCAEVFGEWCEITIEELKKDDSILGRDDWNSMEKEARENDFNDVFVLKATMRTLALGVTLAGTATLSPFAFALGALSGIAGEFWTRKEIANDRERAKKMLQDEISAKIYQLDSRFEAWLEREYEGLLQALNERRQLWIDDETRALEKDCEAQKSARDWAALERRVDEVGENLFAKTN